MIETLKITSLTLVSIFLQIILTKHFEFFYLLDIPLIVVVYFATYKSRVQSCLIGGVVGLIQDSISGLPLGMNGFSKTLLGYLSAAASRRFVIEQFGILLSMMLVACFLDSLIKQSLFVITGLPLPARFFIAPLIQALLTTPPGAGAIAGLTKLDRWR